MESFLTLNNLYRIKILYLCEFYHYNIIIHPPTTGNDDQLSMHNLFTSFLQFFRLFSLLQFITFPYNFLDLFSF